MTIEGTFSEVTIDRAMTEMNSKEVSVDEVEDYVRKINFLKTTDYSNSQNLDHLLEMTKRLGIIFVDVEQKVKTLMANFKRKLCNTFTNPNTDLFDDPQPSFPEPKRISPHHPFLLPSPSQSCKPASVTNS